MRIFVPSTKRAFPKGKCTATQISPEWRPHTFFVVPMDEVELYKRWIRGIPHYNHETCIIGTEQRGIANTRMFIGHLCKAAKQASFCMMDDDLISWGVRESGSNTKLLPQKPADFSAMMLELMNRLRVYAHVSISTREGNNNTPAGPSPRLVENTRTLRVLAYQTKAFLAMQHGRVPVMEDFDVNLQLLRAGYANCVLAYWTHDQRGTGVSGGCSTYRTHEMQDAAAKELAELHPGFVKLRQKQNKTGGVFGTRTEVTIAWKKAFEDGQKLVAAQLAAKKAAKAKKPKKEKVNARKDADSGANRKVGKAGGGSRPGGAGRRKDPASRVLSN